MKKLFLPNTHPLLCSICKAALTLLLLATTTCLFAQNPPSEELTQELSELRTDVNENRIARIYNLSIKNSAHYQEIADTLLNIRQSLPQNSLKDSLSTVLTYYISAIYIDANQLENGIKYAKQGISLDKTNYTFYHLYGLSLYKQSKNETGEKQKTLQKEALEQLNKALEVWPETKFGYIKSKYDTYPSRVYHTMGYLYLSMVKNIHDKNEREYYLEQIAMCFSKVSGVTHLTSSFYFNRVLCLANLAQYKSPEKADSLYLEAKTMLQKYATRKMDDSYINYYMWGGCLQYLGNIRHGAEADSLYQASIDKFEIALTLIKEPMLRTVVPLNTQKEISCYEAIQHSYAKIAAPKNRSKAKPFRKKVAYYGKQAVELGAEPYNQACAYAIIGNSKKAFGLLNESLEKKQILFEKVANDANWDRLRLKPKYLQLEKKYKL